MFSPEEHTNSKGKNMMKRPGYAGPSLRTASTHDEDDLMKTDSNMDVEDDVFIGSTVPEDVHHDADDDEGAYCFFVC